MKKCQLNYCLRNINDLWDWGVKCVVSVKKEDSGSMKEKHASVTVQEVVRQRIAQWEGRGTGGDHHLHPSKGSARDTPALNIMPEVVDQAAKVALDGQVSPTPALTPPSSASSGSSVQDHEFEEPLLKDSSSLRLNTPVRNAAVRRFWQQQVRTTRG